MPIYIACLNIFHVMPAGIVINSVEDFIAMSLQILDTAEREALFLYPPSLLSLAGTCDTVEHVKRFVERGGVVRGITTVSPANIEETRMRLDAGEDLRHSNTAHEVFMFVGDRQHSVSVTNVGVEEFTLDTPITAFWSDDPTYAAYLLVLFETAWKNAIPADQRLHELEKE